MIKKLWVVNEYENHELVGQYVFPRKLDAQEALYRLTNPPSNQGGDYCMLVTRNVGLGVSHTGIALPNCIQFS